MFPHLSIHYTKNWTRSPDVFCQVDVKKNKTGTSYGFAVLGAVSTPQSPFNCFRLVQSQRLNSLVNDVGGVRLWPWTPVTFLLLGLVPVLFKVLAQSQHLMCPSRVPGSILACVAPRVRERAEEVESSPPPVSLVVSSRWSTVALILPLLLTSGRKPKVPSGFSIIMLWLRP